MGFGVVQNFGAFMYPAPDEWSMITSYRYRQAFLQELYDVDNNGGERRALHTDWGKVGDKHLLTLARLEDQDGDGKGIVKQDEGENSVDGVVQLGYDITAKSEEWRRGYFDVLMGCGRAAEHMDEHVRDVTRNLVFAANTVIGPSNPYHRPVKHWQKHAPKEGDCVTAFDPPEKYYLRILTTSGFNEKQRLDAALAYASWLDYKKTPIAAEEMYNWALEIALSTQTQFAGVQPIVDPKTNILNPSTGIHPNENVLDTVTAIAKHHAQIGNVSTAVPILLSLLRARRSLPEKPKTRQEELIPEPPTPTDEIFEFLRIFYAEMPFPRPPPDGSDPPIRNRTSQLCEEAALMAYIGEILYTSPSSEGGSSAISSTGSGKTSSKEDGLAWTREAVDIAEEQLRKERRVLYRSTIVRRNVGKPTCERCLVVGLENWDNMVRLLADVEKREQEEKEREEFEKRRKVREAGGKAKGWFDFGFGFGGTGSESGSGGETEALDAITKSIEAKKDVIVGRWESEQAVVRERFKRVEDIIGPHIGSQKIRN